VSVRSRAAFATGVAGLVGATLLLSGRFEGSAVVVLLFVWVARVAPAASLLDAGPLVASGAGRSLRTLGAYAPAWTLVVATGLVRAGGGALADVRGANAVAGLAIARGSPATVAGVWLCLLAGVIATSSWPSLEVATAAPAGTVGLAAPPPPAVRLAVLGALAQVGLLAALFVGPQVRTATDGVWWGASIVVLAAAAWFLRRYSGHRLMPVLATGLAGLGLVLALLGGAP
jgi:hypothetical protein